MTVPLSHLIAQSSGDSDAVETRSPKAASDAFTREMQEFYSEVDAAVAARSPICVNRGHCCKFDSFGHKLYVTDVELRYFAEGMRANWTKPSEEAACPYQSNGRCQAREHRPLGCRIFFCDPDAQAWQGPEYERFLSRLKELGDAHSVPYRYREWLSALTDCPVGGD